MPKSFIETQFPVSKISKESYKERKAGSSQTLTCFGKWWGRKPLILVRAVILGCLMPASNNPKKDREIFLKILSMDEKGLCLRKEKNFTTEELYKLAQKERKLQKYLPYFSETNGKFKLSKDAPKEQLEKVAFSTLSYDQKLTMCKRPEHLKNITEDTWREINHHLNTNANSLAELVEELSQRVFGHNIKVGDCFCGGGSIPFESARMGCETFASDLNPIAGLLTWADLNICGANETELKEIRAFQEEVYQKVNAKIKALGIEENEQGDRAFAYLYCNEVICPECGYKVPLAPSWVIGKGTKTVAKLIEKEGFYDFEVKMNASSSEMKTAELGTVNTKGLNCPHCKKVTPISTLRHDTVVNGETKYGLRLWQKDEFLPKANDVFHERLYAIKYEHSSNGKVSRYYQAPSKRDLENESKVETLVKENFSSWQSQGLIPSMEIEEGLETTRLIRERGWKYWHQLFNARQLLVLGMLMHEISSNKASLKAKVACLLGVNKCIDWDSKLCMWHNGRDETERTFSNQALNTLFIYGTRSLQYVTTCWFYDMGTSKNSNDISSNHSVLLSDARSINDDLDLWLTDPPYADAVNYHELSEFFLAWDKKLLKEIFPEWYADSKRALAVRGDDKFSQTMIEIYSNLTKHLSDNGMQVVMFTHSDPAVWAELAIIMWKAGLKVTSAWNIATETDASGLKSGNYVKGTVVLVLRKQTGQEIAFLDEISADIREEVKKQIKSMQELEDKEDPNFADPDYVLAAYAASLRVLTSYAQIEDLNLDYELNLAISRPKDSKVVAIIENAKKIAYDLVIPQEFNHLLWRDLTNSEKFYIKGLESEKHNDYQLSTYQEFARGFSFSGFDTLLSSKKANETRLLTPFEMANRRLSDLPEFQNSLLRIIFGAIYAGIKEDFNPQKALSYIKTSFGAYWTKRELIMEILKFLISPKDLDNMKPHWQDSSVMAELLLTSVEHDGV